MLNIVICDDELHFHNYIKELISSYLDKQDYDHVITCFQSGKELIKSGTDIVKYDIVFLDVQMDEIDGIETAKYIRKMSKDVFIVYVTAFISYSLEGYKVGAIRYLLKDNKHFKDSVEECLNAIISQMTYQIERRSFEFLSGEKEVLIDRIMYIESSLHKVKFFILENGTKEYQMYEKLDKISEELRPYGFVRAHQSFLVNMKYVKNVERYTAQLIDGTIINISKRYFKETMTAYIKARGNI